ncbi:DUF2716 domain-containing protein [Streptomyces nojiriensis]|uniref:DUF2716 domain-containing protein n=1 Tax=Streptomyces nojiriensis TaxID=66374 RepID=UPI00399A2377
MWDRFCADFDFKPSTTCRPAITEPVPSAVWHLHAHHRPVQDVPGRIDAIVRRGLLTDDLRLGTFGHPWEQTLTVWGPTLPAAVETELTELLGAPIRCRT